jgi:hypothetical protein
MLRALKRTPPFAPGGAAAVLIAGLASACATPPSADTLDALIAFDSRVLAESAAGSLTDVASIEALGLLREKVRVPYEAAHAEGQWDDVTFRFDGLQVTALVRREPPHEALVTGIVISSPEWPLASGLAVGMPASRIRMKIPPDPGLPLRFCGLDNCVEFEVQRGRISRILLSLHAE